MGTDIARDSSGVWGLEHLWEGEEGHTLAPSEVNS